jgi:superfamily II DNA or RNA helicase
MADSSKGLQLVPYQAAFVDAFLLDESRRNVLVAPVGTGKSHTVVALIARLAEADPEVHILLVAPHILQLQFLAMAASAGARMTPLQVDGRTLREIAADGSHAGLEVDPPLVAVTSLEVLRRSNAIQVLAGVGWNLVVVDEAHLLSKADIERLEELLGDEGRLLLVGQQSPLRGGTLAIPDATVYSWDAALVTDTPRLSAMVVEYERSTEERKCLETVLSSYGNGSALHEGRRGSSESLGAVLRAASSSIPALEGVLLRHRNRLAHASPDPSIEEYAEIAESSEESDGKPPDISITTLTEAIECLDSISVDPKAEALVSLVRSELRTGEAFCVFTEFVATANYLFELLAARGIATGVLTGSSEVAERVATVAAFRESGGVLILTDASAIGLDLGAVAGAVSYDLPATPSTLARRWGTVARLAPNTEVRMWALRDTSRMIELEEKRLHEHRFLSETSG